MTTKLWNVNKPQADRSCKVQRLLSIAGHFEHACARMRAYVLARIYIYIRASAKCLRRTCANNQLRATFEFILNNFDIEFGFEVMERTSAEPGRKVAYSRDIGWRVVWQKIGMGLTFRQIAARLQIATGTAHRIFMRFRETGDVSPTSRRAQP